MTQWLERGENQSEIAIIPRKDILDYLDGMYNSYDPAFVPRAVRGLDHFSQQTIPVTEPPVRFSSANGKITVSRGWDGSAEEIPQSNREDFLPEDVVLVRNGTHVLFVDYPSGVEDLQAEDELHFLARGVAEVNARVQQALGFQWPKIKTYTFLNPADPIIRARESAHKICPTPRNIVEIPMNGLVKNVLDQGRLKEPVVRDTAHQLVHGYQEDYRVHAGNNERQLDRKLEAVHQAYMSLNRTEESSVSREDLRMSQGRVVGYMAYYLGVSEFSGQFDRLHTQLRENDFDPRLVSFNRHKTKAHEFSLAFDEGLAQLAGSYIAGEKRSAPQDASFDLDNLYLQSSNREFGSQIIPEFLDHIRDQYGLSFPDIFHTLGQIPRLRFSLRSFFQLLDLGQEEN